MDEQGRAKTLQEGLVEVEVPLGDGWWAYAVIAHTHRSAPQVLELRIFPGGDQVRRGPLGEWPKSVRAIKRAAAVGGGLTAARLRTVHLHDLVRRAHAETSEPNDPDVRAPDPGGRRPAPEWFMGFEAITYANAVRSGSRHPARDFAEAFELSEAAARSRIRRLRAKGYLTEAVHGRADSSATAKALKAAKFIPNDET